jgi:hypothetical protein
MDDRHFGFVIKFLKRALLLTSGPRNSGKELAKRRYEDQWQEGTYYYGATVNQNPPEQGEGWMISDRKQFSVQFPS